MSDPTSRKITLQHTAEAAVSGPHLATRDDALQPVHILKNTVQMLSRRLGLLGHAVLSLHKDEALADELFALKGQASAVMADIDPA